MATTTTNLALIKPAGTDKIRIAQINSNMDTLDSKIGPVGSTNLQAQVNAKAPLASPALTGTPTAPTAAAGTNTTQVATTAFVQSAAAKLEALVVNCGTISSLPATISNANIENDMVVLQSTLGTPSAQTGDWTVTTNNGSLTISGSISGSTTLTLYLMKSR